MSLSGAWENEESPATEAEERAISLRVASLEGLVDTLSTQSQPDEDLIADLEIPADTTLPIVAETLMQSVVTVHAGGAIGSGFVIADRTGDLVIITNQHVVAGVWSRGLREVTVNVGEREFQGRIDRVSTQHDLATILADIDLPPLSTTHSVPEVGSAVVAVGSPYGFEGTLTTGVVSAHREDRIQFSAPVSPGNSGGPLTDSAGTVIGVVVEKVTGVGAEGLSFAIPISVVCSTLTSCREPG